MKKILLISYYWPPAGGGGVQRWLKMSKYLPENGWTPIVYTAQPKTFVAEDKSLINEVHQDIEIIRTPIFEPYDLYAKLTGQKKESANYSGFINNKKSSFAQRLSIFIRSNFFIPDARMFWIKPSVKYLTKWIKNNQIDVIVSNGPPHSMHVIALALKKKFPDIPWVADFRDPWTDIDFYKDLNLLKFADRKHRRLEKKVLDNADEVVAVTWEMSNELKLLSNKQKVSTILNGFDPEDFKSFHSIKNEKFIICHLGSMNKDRNPANLWKSLQNIIRYDENFKSKLEIHLIGPVDINIIQSIKEYNLAPFTRVKKFIPHNEAIDFMQHCKLLLLPINNAPNSKGILPGKMYEYLATKIPILAIGPLDGDIAKVMNEMNHCSLCAYDDLQGIESFINSVWKDPKIATGKIEKYSRKFHAANYARLLNELVRN